MPFTNSVYVTASNPPPGTLRPIDGAIPDASGNMAMQSDGGLGVNTYIAGGSGVSGSVLVSIVGQVSGSGGSTTITQPKTIGSSGTVPFQISTSDHLFMSGSRISFTILNDSRGTYLVKLGAPANQTTYSFYIPAGSLYESPFPSWQGDVYGIGFSGDSTATGNIVFEELSP